MALPRNALADLKVDFDVSRREVLISRRLKNFVDPLYCHAAMGYSGLDGLCDHDRFQNHFQLDERLHEVKDGLLVAWVFTCERHTHQKGRNSTQAHPLDGEIQPAGRDSTLLLGAPVKNARSEGHCKPSNAEQGSPVQRKCKFQFCT